MRKLLRDESGVTLIVALLILVVISSTGITVLHFSSSSARTSEVAADDTRSDHLAEAGVSYARSILWNASDPSDADVIGSGSFPLEGGTVTYSGVLSGSVWTLTGTATVPNPAVPGSTLESSVTTQVAIATAILADDSAWDYFYAGCEISCGDAVGGGGCYGSGSGGGGCGSAGTSGSGGGGSGPDCGYSTYHAASGSGGYSTSTSVGAAIVVKDTASVNSRVYSRENLCLEISSTVNDDVYVLGSTHLASSARIGASGSQVAEVQSSGGCSYSGNTISSPCTASQRVYASVSGTTPPDVAKPPVDLGVWYTNASPGPSNPCTSGNVPGGFDNDSTGNDSRTDFDLTPGSAYNCKTSSGQLKYTPGNPGQLTIDGTIFFDGDIVASNSVIVNGRATIYAAGTVKIENGVQICGISGCGSGWDPSTNLLVFVAGSSTDGVGFLLNGSSKFQGGVYAVQDAKFSGSSEFWGTIVVDEAIVKGSASVNYKSLGTLMSGMPLPGSGTAPTTLILENITDSFSPS